MRYFEAVGIANKPYIYWNSIANNETELGGRANDPLVVAEVNIPLFQYGICPWKIVSGTLVARTTEEMEAAETEFLQTKTNDTRAAKIKSINRDKFTYGGWDFPMHEVARNFYAAMQYLGGNTKVKDLTGIERTIEAPDHAAFFTAYFTKLRSLTQ